jgi:Hint domain
MTATTAPHAAEPPGQAIQVFPAAAIRVVIGANLGDPIGVAEDCQRGDIYRLDPAARPLRLVLSRPGADGNGGQRIAPGSGFGQPGDRLLPQSVLILLAPDGERLVIVTILHDPTGMVFALPLSPMRPRVEFTLVDFGENAENVRLSDVICVSFAAGTMITLPGGLPKVVQSLRPGDMVLTRDNGAQPLRWVGKATLRAAGSFAPVVISAGTLGNSGELVVSPHHRIFIYQRGQRRLGLTAEIFVQAKHLVDGERVWRREGGFVDYYSLVFDRHEIVYAEGIPVESLLVTDETVRMLPAELAESLVERFPGLKQSPHFATEATRATLDAAGRDSLYPRDGQS